MNIATVSTTLRSLTVLVLLFDSAMTAVAQTDVPIWTRFEAEETSTNSYRNPLLDVRITVEFRAPDGGATTVPAFWDYGPSWKVRFSPDQIGKWTYRWTSSDAADVGLHDRSGEFNCVSYQGENPLYRHGAIGTSEAGGFFAHADGTPFFWLGDTAWNGALLAAEDEWEIFLRDRRQKRFSVVQFVMTQWRSAAGDENGRPAFIIRRDKVEIDPIFFQRMDRRVDAINDHGLVAAPVMFWTHGGHPRLNPGHFLSGDQLVAVGLYMIARYGAHHVAWLLGGDGSYQGDHAEKWRLVGRELFGSGKPGIPRPVTMHAGFWCADAFQTEDWWTFNGYQSGHARQRGIERVTSGEPTRYWKTDPKRPVMNIEPNYEAHRNRMAGATGVFDSLDVRRLAYYSLLVAPPAGLTYGAHGIWGWHPRAEEPMTHPGTGVGPAWHDAMKLPGSLHLKYLVDLFTKIEWTRLRPAQDLLAEQPGDGDAERFVAVARTTDGGSLLAYVPPRTSIKLKASELIGMTAAHWYSPRSGEWIRADIGSGQLRVFEPPSEADWVLFMRR